MAKKVHLKMLISKLRKGSLSMTEYFIKLKTVTDGLALAGSLVSNIDVVTHLIARLDQCYYTVVESNMLIMDLGEAYPMLLTNETGLKSSKFNDSELLWLFFRVSHL